jgi:hypothetical protein
MAENGNGKPKTKKAKAAAAEQVEAQAYVKPAWVDAKQAQHTGMYPGWS